MNRPWFTHALAIVCQCSLTSTLLMCDGSFIPHRNYVAVLIHQLLFATSPAASPHFKLLKMNLTSMGHCSVVILQFLCRAVQFSNATQLQCSMNGPSVSVCCCCLMWDSLQKPFKRMVPSILITVNVRSNLIKTFYLCIY